MERKRLIGATTVLFIGITMLGASAGWWDWRAVGAGALIGAALGMLLQMLLQSRGE